MQEISIDADTLDIITRFPRSNARIYCFPSVYWHKLLGLYGYDFAPKFIKVYIKVFVRYAHYIE